MSIENETTEVVDGSGFDSRMQEIAAENGIELGNPESEVPNGEATEGTTQANEADLEQKNSTSENDSSESADLTPEDVPVESPEEDEELPKGFRKQLKRKERQIHRLKEQHSSELDSLRAELEELKKGFAPKEQKLTSENFRTQEEYVSYLAEQKVQELLQKQQQEQIQAAEYQQKYSEMESSWSDKLKSNFNESEMNEFSESIQEFGNPSNYFGKDVTEYMFKHANGPRILKHFVDNPENIDSFNNMHMWDKVAYLQNIATTVQPKPAPAVSKAAPPVGSLKNESSPKKSINEMSDAELLESYRKNPSLFH